MSSEPTVYVVDDDEEARVSVCALVRSMGLPTRDFVSGEAFLDFFAEHDVYGCLVTDHRMLGMSGIELQEKLAEMGSEIPVIILTAFARTPLTVRAMRSGAVTMLDKPYHDDDLWDAISKALALEDERRAARGRAEAIRRRMTLLSPSEKRVLDLVVAGEPNKVIARRLGVSLRTVENRRREIFSKMQAPSVAELVRLVIESEEA
ncbi:MAG: response regulator transcription factor [Pirellulaceae bacterium]